MLALGIQEMPWSVETGGAGSWKDFWVYLTLGGAVIL